MSKGNILYIVTVLQSNQFWGRRSGMTKQGQDMFPALKRGPYKPRTGRSNPQVCTINVNKKWSRISYKAKR